MSGISSRAKSRLGIFDGCAVELSQPLRWRRSNILSNYAELSASFPQELVERYALKNKKGGPWEVARLRRDGLEEELANLPRAWRDWILKLHGPEFTEETHEFIDPLVRRVTGECLKYRVKAQLVVCAPRDHPHRVIGPHCDTQRTLWVMEIFFPCPEDQDESGGFDYYTGAARFNSPDSVLVDPATVSMVESVPYQHNAACGFVNSRQAIHSSGLRNPSMFPRRYVSISGHTGKQFFK